MNIVILGAAGFIGTNLSLKLAADRKNRLTLIDQKMDYFQPVLRRQDNINLVESELSNDTDFGSLVDGQEFVYHLMSTTIPKTSNQHIAQELNANVVTTANLLDACVKKGIKKVVFISSGGTVYGKELACPLKETMLTYPISSYGIQKITIEKLLYLYNYLYALDYRVVRLANPYGPYQRPNGGLGAVTTFIYHALTDNKITVYGDGSVVRDYIYIDDAIRGIINIANGEVGKHTFNLGSGIGININEVLRCISATLGLKLNVVYEHGRKCDVPVNYLDITKYEKYLGKLNPISLSEGIIKTAEFMRKNLL